MIHRTQGDILQANADALVNTVNCVGYMGRGIALQFKRAFPRNNVEYVAACKRGEVVPGRMLVHDTNALSGPRYIINFPTKRHWRGRSRIEDIEAGLVDLVEVLRDREIRSVAIPPLGAGLGGLEWADVRPRIESALAVLPDVEVLLFEPTPGGTDQRLPSAPEVPKMTPGRATLVALVAEYLAGMMDTEVSLLEIHKLLYFMQEAGEPLRLRFKQGHYGPYAENLRHVLTQVEGYLLSGYMGADEPDRPMHLVPGALEDARSYLEAHADTRARLSRVTDLVEGYESGVGLELLASIHWIARAQDVRNPDDAVAALHAWNDRKRRFTPDQVRIAWTTLESKGWVSTSAVAIQT
jgi:O-acetyl-ADP-ribose deacetylase (regulator of RNase III)